MFEVRAFRFDRAAPVAEKEVNYADQLDEAMAELAEKAQLGEFLTNAENGHDYMNGFTVYHEV